MGPPAGHQLWWVFVTAAVVAGILATAFIASVIIQQRRYLSATRALGGRLLAAQEEERAWVARELHDDLIQRVAVLGREIELLDRTTEAVPSGGVPPGGAVRRLAGVRTELDDLAEQIRRLAHRMHPSVLDHLGLPAALAALGDEFAEAGLEVAVESRVPADGMPAETATCLYRVAQEGLRNVAKHAGAVRAAVRLSGEAGGYVLEVEDGGAGFDPGSAGGRGGLGLTSLSERVRQLDGRFIVRSFPGQGTRLTAWLPGSPG